MTYSNVRVESDTTPTQPTGTTSLRHDTLLLALSFEKSADVRRPIVTALVVKDSADRKVVEVELTEHDLVHLLSGSVLSVGGWVS